MPEDTLNTDEAEVTADQYTLQQTVKGTDLDGNPQEVENRVTYPREAAEKPYMGQDEEKTDIREGHINHVSFYHGITPEQELAIQGHFAGASSAETVSSQADGPGASDVVAGRPVETPAGAGEPSDATATECNDEPTPTGVPTGISDTLRELPERIGEQIRQQLSDVQGFSITITRGEDGSLQVEGDIRRTDGDAQPSSGIPQAVYTEESPKCQVTGEPANLHREESHQAVSVGTQPTIASFVVGTQAGQPTNGTPDPISTNVSSAASASTRNNALIVTKLGTIEGVAFSINVNLFNLTIDAG